MKPQESENHRMEITRMFFLYGKLRSYLRAVPAMRDPECGFIPVQERFWRANPEQEKYKYRIARVLFGDVYTHTHVVIVFEPNERHYSPPTFRQFLEAYELLTIRCF